MLLLWEARTYEKRSVENGKGSKVREKAKGKMKKRTLVQLHLKVR